MSRFSSEKNSIKLFRIYLERSTLFLKEHFSFLFNLTSLNPILGTEVHRQVIVDRGDLSAELNTSALGLSWYLPILIPDIIGKTV